MAWVKKKRLQRSRKATLRKGVFSRTDQANFKVVSMSEKLVEVKRCSKCGRELPKGSTAKKCPYCGGSLTIVYRKRKRRVYHHEMPSGKEVPTA